MKENALHNILKSILSLSLNAQGRANQSTNVMYKRGQDLVPARLEGKTTPKSWLFCSNLRQFYQGPACQSPICKAGCHSKNGFCRWMFWFLGFGFIFFSQPHISERIISENSDLRVNAVAVLVSVDRDVRWGGSLCLWRFFSFSGLCPAPGLCTWHLSKAVPVSLQGGLGQISHNLWQCSLPGRLERPFLFNGSLCGRLRFQPGLLHQAWWVSLQVKMFRWLTISGKCPTCDTTGPDGQVRCARNVNRSRVASTELALRWSKTFQRQAPYDCSDATSQSVNLSDKIVQKSIQRERPRIR